jgi:hypothetical protein
VFHVWCCMHAKGNCGELTPYVVNGCAVPCQDQNRVTWSLIQRALCILRLLFPRMDVRLFLPCQLNWSGRTVQTIVQGLGNHSVFLLGPMVTDILTQGTSLYCRICSGAILMVMHHCSRLCWGMWCVLFSTHRKTCPLVLDTSHFSTK